MRRTKLGHDHPLNCDYCGIELIEDVHPAIKHSLTVDHRVPICKGGSMYDFNNFSLACLKCNLNKGEEVWKKKQN